jgi:hypothetical protein
MHPTSLVLFWKGGGEGGVSVDFFWFLLFLM